MSETYRPRCKNLSCKSMLVYGEGYSYSEAANALGIPVGTVMSRLATARSALAKLK